MRSELLSVLEYMEKEKGISRQNMIDSIATAVSSAAKKSLHSGQDVRVEIDPRTGAMKAWAQLKVVDSVSDPKYEIHVTKAKQTYPNIAIGEIFEQEIDPSIFGRIAAQTARQMIMQQIRRFEKEHIYEQFQDRVGTIITGIVRYQERGDLVIDFGKAEGTLYRRDSIWSDDYTPGERICCLLQEIKATPRGPELVLTRSHVDFVRRLLECEVVELAEGTVFIKSIVRDPGYRTKICVDTKDSKIDPVGACVGTRGSRIKNVLKELGQEKIDVIRYSSDLQTLLKEAVRPAVPQNIVVDEPRKVLRFDLEEKDFAVFVGKKGQNLRLTSRLLGWELEVKRLERVELGFEDKKVHAMQVLSQLQSVTAVIAARLVEMGITSIEAFEGVTEDDLVDAGLLAEEAKAILEEAQKFLKK
jgi:transcription termination factor NusA